MSLCKITCSSDVVSSYIDSSSTVRLKYVPVILFVIFCATAQQNQPICGKRQNIPTEINLRIWNGEAAKQDGWPWHATIYHQFESTLSYACGGTIIDTKTILTAAHCFYSHHHRLSENEVAVHVGREDLNKITIGLQVLIASKLIVHPEFNLNGVEHDIALVKLSNGVALTRFIQPVSLWCMDDDERQIVGKIGTVIGFGLNERDLLPGFLQAANLTVVHPITCLAKDRATYGAVLTHSVFCAGGAEGVSACNGDSGGGMYFDVNGTWYLRGIVAFSPMRRNDTALCDPYKYTVFTDVSKYRNWILQASLEPCENTILPSDTMCNIAHRFDHGFLLVQERNKTIRVPLDGGPSFLIAKGSYVVGINRDCADGRFYWSDEEEQQIFSSKYDGTDRKPFVTEEITSPLGMTVDWISRRLYWTNWRKKIIVVASMENSDVRMVLISTNLVKPYAIAVDPIRSKLYWTDNGAKAPKIEWSNLDGSERQILVSSPRVMLPFSIQVSAVTGELCYADVGTKKIECIDPYSKQIRTIAANLTAIGLTVTDELFYWINQIEKRIESINIHGVRQEPITSPIIEGTLLYVTAVSDKCPYFYSPCAVNNGECPENTICLVNPRAPSGKICKCTRNCEDV